MKVAVFTVFIIRVHALGCFECYDIYCQRCESKDRRILELEVRNNEMAKYIAYLNGMLFPRGDSSQSAAATPIINDPNKSSSTASASFSPLNRLFGKGK